MSRAAGARGDVWSLGCVIWEAVTLGATPYPGVRARDVMTRVTRGLRAPHPAGASDTLYQLMLSCWMLDPDERPEPGEAADTLRELGHVCCQHLSFVLPQTEFRYEPHEPSLELLAGSHSAAPSTTSTAGSFV